MNEQEKSQETTPSRHYWNIILHRRWWLIASTVIVWAGALGVSLVLHPAFKSQTLVLIEQDSVSAQYVTPNVSIDLQQRLRSLAEQILSRTQLARIIDEHHLYNTPPNQEVSEDAVKRMRSDITVELIKPGGQDNVSAFKIGYSARTPELAQQVTGELSSLFIEDSLHNQQQLSEDTTVFLENQLDTARKDLQQKEAQLADFRKRYLGELPEQLSGNVQILSGLQNRLETATTALHQAEQQKLYLASMLGSSTPSDDSPAAPATNLDEQIDKMRAELAELRTHYKPEYPDIVHLEDQIANAEKARGELRKSLSSPTAAEDAKAQAEPVLAPMSQLQSQFKANELEIANRKREIKGLEAQIAQYQDRLNLTPLRQQQLAEVTRNYEQSRTNYEQLLTKKLQSGMATDLTKRREGGQFRMIDPPSLPQKPYWPNRLLFSGLGVFGGLCLGLGMIGLMETVDARIRSEDDLKRWVALPVLGTVPPLLSYQEKHKLAWLRGVEITVICLVALVIPIVSLAIYSKS